MTRDELNVLECEAPDHADEAMHFKTCIVCHERYDLRRLGDVLHHWDCEKAAALLREQHRYAVHG